MADFIDDFLAGLEEDKQQPRQQDGIEKVLMSSRDNQGTVVFAPFQDTFTKKFYLLVNNVREFKTPLSTYRNGADAVWVKILPKEFYGELTQQQSMLYDEVLGLFDEVNTDMGEVNNKWNIIRTRSYSLFQGVLINHINPSGAQQKERLGKPVLLIFPSRQPINELAAAIKNKIAGMNNSKEWIPAVFSPEAKGREGVITISFTKPDQPGYDCSVGFEFNSTYAKIVDPNVGFSEEVTSKFGNVLEEFLGWQNGDKIRFNETNFRELKKIFTTELAKLHAGIPKEEPAPENKNGVDPMLNGDPVAAAAAMPSDPAPQPAPETSASPAPDASPDGGTGVELPF
jgi:hypothetical protein